MTSDHPRWHYRMTSLINADADTVNEHLELWAVAGWELVSAAATDWAVGVSGGGTRHVMYWKWPLPRTTDEPFGLDPDAAASGLAAARAAGLRSDGVYLLPDAEQGYTQGLLFRKGGGVRSVTVSGSTTAPEEVAKGAASSPYRGQYVFEDGELRFRIGGEHPVDYRGTIAAGGELQLAIHAHFNDSRRQETYRFAPVAGR